MYNAEVSSRCLRVFTWDTVYVCPPIPTDIPETAPPTEVADITVAPPPEPTTLKPFVPLSHSQCIASGPDGIVDLTALTQQDFTAVCADASDTKCTDYTYNMQICGYTTDVYSGNPAVSAAQTPLVTSTTIKNLGSYVAPPMFKDGVLVLEYTGGDLCHNRYQRSTRVIFECDAHAGLGVPVFQSETPECVYVFTWSTVHACTPSSIPLNCIVEGPNSLYDLHVLGRRPGQSDWLAVGTSPDTIAINVCQRLQTYVSSDCEGAAMCVSINNGTETFSLGYAMSEPVLLANKGIQLNYTFPLSESSKLCSKHVQRSAVITFLCSPGVLGEPVLVAQDADCEYFFTWETYAACNLYSATAITGSNCAVYNNLTGNFYDLSALSQSNVSISSDKYEFDIRVCGDAGGHCAAGSGGCQVDLTNSDKVYEIGATSSAIIVDGQAVYLKLMNGTKCHAGTKDEANRGTVIRFVCNPAVSIGSPVYVNESLDCVYFFEWETAAACPVTEDVDCTTVDPATGNQYDLTPLKLFRRNWEIQNSKTKGYAYEINVCRSLNAPSNPSFAHCPRTAGGCQANTSNTKEVYSIGKAAAPTFANGKLTILYDHGSLCHNNQPRTTLVTFVCPQNPSSSAFPLGFPEFSGETSHCQYEVTWESSAACPVVPPQTEVSCQLPFSNPVTGESYQLAPLNKIYHASDGAGNFFLINFCEPLGSQCSHDPSARVCQYTSGGNFSAGDTPAMHYRDGTFSMLLTGGTPCHANNAFERSTLITFTCAAQVCLFCHACFVCLSTQSSKL